jgi:hypothetical protein
VKLLLCAGLTLWLIGYAISFFLPLYDLALRLPSSDGRYDLVVLRGDKAAFDDFFYHVYVIPHDLKPQDAIKQKRVWMTGIWRGSKYLVYSGYSYPALRWTAPRSAEIDINDLYVEIQDFHPVKKLDGSDPVLISLGLGKEDKRNSLP